MKKGSLHSYMHILRMDLCSSLRDCRIRLVDRWTRRSAALRSAGLPNATMIESPRQAIPMWALPQRAKAEGDALSASGSVSAHEMGPSNLA